MRELRDSDLFAKEINRNNSIYGRINRILSGGDPSAVILNEILFPEIKRKILDNRKEKIITDIGNAITSYRMILLTNSPETKITDAVPFFTYKQDGKKKVMLNLASIVRQVKNPDNSISYELGDASKVYSILYGGYLALAWFENQTEISPSTLYDAAVVWAAMFNKPLYDAVGMNNQERNDAFMYFAMKFFLVYLMGCKEDHAESITMKYFNNRKNDLILFMEEKIEEKDINMYEGIIPFMKMLFDNDITQIRGVRVNNLSNSINVSFYLEKFVTTYSTNALLALCTFPYFIYVLIAAKGKSKMVKDKSFDKIFSTYTRESNRLFISLTKE
jgi:hypothetical protein